MHTPDSPNVSGGSVTHFFGQLRTGDPGAAEAIWSRFFPRLVALARQAKKLSHEVRVIQARRDVAVDMPAILADEGDAAFPIFRRQDDVFIW